MRTPEQRAKKAAYMREWLARGNNRERVRAQERASRHARREVINAQKKARRLAKIEAARKAGREYYHEPRNKQRIRENNLRRCYGITNGEFERLFSEQGGKCRICECDLVRPNKQAKSANVDHDHATGRVRGLLCAKCNRGIGLLKDDPRLLMRAIAHLSLNVLATDAA